MTGGFATRVVLQGAMIGGLSLVANRIGFYWESLNWAGVESFGGIGGADVAHTMTFAVLAFSQIMLILGIRSNTASAFRGMFTNRWLWGAFAVVSAMMFAVLEIPALKDIFHVANLNWAQWGWVIALSFAPLVITEVVKLVVRLFDKK
jgi:Ca2+-transporting ATPase